MYYRPTAPYLTLEISKIYIVHYFEYRKDFTFAGESHNFRELMYVDKG